MKILYTLYSILNTSYSIPKLAFCLLIASTIMMFLNDNVSAQSLRVAPLKYEEQLKLGAEKIGYVDVSNPSGSTITVNTQVQAFRQMNIQGDLEFYDDEQIQKAIEVDVDEFELGPREAARIFFSINSNKLPEGGVYAAVLFSADEERVADSEDIEISAINTTSRVGTLLILENGDNGVRDGDISKLDIPFWQLGTGINGAVEFSAFEGERFLAFEPGLKMSVPIAGEKDTETGLVFAGNTRRFDVDMPGDYIGIFPVKAIDEVTGSTEHDWVFAVTGIWRIIVPFFLLAITASILLQRYFSSR